MKRFLIGSSIAYLIILLIGWAMIHFDDGSNWLVTLFLFSPRWVAAVPMALMLPMMMLVCFRWSFMYLAHAAVIAVPILGIQIPMESNSIGTGPTLRVMTCNLGGGHVWQNEIVHLVRSEQIEVLMLQECPTLVSIPLFEQLGWNHQQQYNMAIGSVHELSEPEVIARQPKEQYEVAAAIVCQLRRKDEQANVDDQPPPFHLVSLHLPTFRPAMQKAREFDPDTGQAIKQMGETYRKIASEAHQNIQSMSGPMIIAGDFNVPVESIYYREFWSEFSNAQSDVGLGLGYTKFTSVHGVRIDHVLVNEDWTVLRSRVGKDFGGDHRPVIVELQRR